MTLIELLVAVALTLMVILAIVRVFDILGGNVTESRAILELSGELRNASNLLQTDLDSLTAPTLPPLEPQSGLGYLEIVEGVRTDWDSDGDRLLHSAAFQDYLNPYRLPTDTTGDPDGFTDPLPPENVPLFDSQYLQNVGRILGDTDDVLMGTIRSRGAPFTGRFLGGTIQSELAEVVWWVEPVRLPLPPGTPPGTINTNPATALAIHRRVLLIRPDLNVQLLAFFTNNPLADLATLRVWLATNDLSVRPIGNLLIANSLDDLTRREHRLAHWPNMFQQLDNWVFPFPVNRTFLVPSSDRSDVVLGDALALDVRAYDPSAPLLRSVGEAYMVAPTDPGFFHLVGAGLTTPQGHGAFVDLGYGYFGGGTGLPPRLTSHFSRLPHPKSRMTLYDTAPRVFCTWSTHYERDGINQDVGNWPDPEGRFPSRQNEGANLVDEGTNGLDDLQDDTGIAGLVDDLNEHETSPPYPVPLRGVEVLLRAQEFSTRQVRQSSVVGDFQPE